MATTAADRRVVRESQKRSGTATSTVGAYVRAWDPALPDSAGLDAAFALWGRCGGEVCAWSPCVLWTGRPASDCDLGPAVGGPWQRGAARATAAPHPNAVIAPAAEDTGGGRGTRCPPAGLRNRAGGDPALPPPGADAARARCGDSMPGACPRRGLAAADIARRTWRSVPAPPLRAVSPGPRAGHRAGSSPVEALCKAEGPPGPQLGRWPRWWQGAGCAGTAPRRVQQWLVHAAGTGLHRRSAGSGRRQVARGGRRRRAVAHLSELS